MALPSSENWDQISDILAQLADVGTDERLDWLMREVPDEVLRGEVEHFLAFEDEDESVLNASIMERRGLFEQALGELSPEAARLFDSGEIIDRYRIEHLIGYGGTGEVYAAEDIEASKRVALKVLRSTDDKVQARMRREYRLLARLDHPHIVRYMAQGRSTEGVPFFVMEYVDGIPITEHCSRLDLPIEERLKLIEQVASAVEHAHEQLIIHRDLKPSNILVNTDGVVKVLDFGISKMLAEIEGDLALTVEVGQEERVAETSGLFIATLSAHQLTPSYAAPEQLRGEPVTQATDMYALGVLCFEVLTGHRPYDLSGLHLVEAAAALETLPIPLASCAVTKKGLEEDSDWLGISNDRFARRLKGDLDAILVKALQLNPAARYQTATRFREDLRRWLTHRPIHAIPANRIRRMILFTRRNLSAVFLGFILTVAFAALIVYSVLLAREAQRETARVTEVQRVFTGLFEGMRPWGGGVPEPSVTELFSFMSERLETTDADPELRIELHLQLGIVADDLGIDSLAERHFDQALMLSRSTNGSASSQEGVVLNRLGILRFRQGRFTEADSLHRDVIDIGRRNRNSQVEYTGLRDLAMTLYAQGQFAEADSISVAALNSCRNSYGTNAATCGEVLTNYGLGQYYARKFEAGDSILHHAIDFLRNHYDEEHPQITRAFGSLGLIKAALGEFDLAITYLRHFLDERTRFLGVGHPLLDPHKGNLGAVLADAGHLEESAEIFEEILANQRRLYGNDYHYVAIFANNLGTIYADLYRYEEAVPLYREALEIWIEMFGAEHLETANTRHNLGRSLGYLGHYAEADQELQAALQLRRSLIGDDHTETAGSLRALGILRTQQRRFADAEAYFREAVEIFQLHFGPDHPQTARALLDLGGTLLEQNRIDEAASFIEEGHATLSSLFGEDHPYVTAANEWLTRLHGVRQQR